MKSGAYIAEEKELADCQQAEIEQLQRRVSELQGELKSELKQHSRATDTDAHVRISVMILLCEQFALVEFFKTLVVMAAWYLFCASEVTTLE